MIIVEALSIDIDNWLQADTNQLYTIPFFIIAGYMCFFYYARGHERGAWEEKAHTGLGHTMIPFLQFSILPGSGLKCQNCKPPGPGLEPHGHVGSCFFHTAFNHCAREPAPHKCI